MDQQELFQKKALNKLSRPGALDKLFVITPSLSWLVLSAVMLLLFSIFIWSIFGVMSDKVVGYGLLADFSGVRVITHDSDGRIEKLYLSPGDEVHNGQVVGTVEKDDLERTYLQLKETLLNSRSNEDIKSRVAQFTSNKEELNKKSQIVSYYDGVIVEKRLEEGDFIQPGTSIYNVKVNQDISGLKAVVYLPVLDGAKVKPGMTVQISPGSIDQDEYGALVGKVIEVSPYPVSSDSIMSETGKNSEFASWLLQNAGGSAIEVIVSLIKDENKKSGYLWTTLTGPNEQLHDGMVCTATAIVKREAPLVKAFNKLGQWLRNS
ncbi:MAG: efflux RND transporter periplasmic adaptor subunit [bacterium]